MHCHAATPPPLPLSPVQDMDIVVDWKQGQSWLEIVIGLEAGAGTGAERCVKFYVYWLAGTVTNQRGDTLTFA